MVVSRVKKPEGGNPHASSITCLFGGDFLLDFLLNLLLRRGGFRNHFLRRRFDGSAFGLSGGALTGGFACGAFGGHLGLLQLDAG